MARLVPQVSLVLRLKMNDLRSDGVCVLSKRAVAIEFQIFILRNGWYGVLIELLVAIWLEATF